MADLSAPLYDSAGTEKGAVELDAGLFGVEPNRAVMHQVTVAHLAERRSGTAKVKSRSEVRGGGRKPWRQKGLGRSRHGSIRSPLWVGGGSAHGPRPRSYAQRTPKKMRGLALRSALSCRAAEGAVKVVEDFEWDAPRTRRAAELLSAIGANGKALVVLADGQGTAEASFRNLPQVILGRAGRLNAYDVLWSDTVVFSGSALSYPEPFLAPEPETPSDAADSEEDVSLPETPVTGEGAAGEGAAEERDEDDAPVAETPPADSDSDSDSETAAPEDGEGESEEREEGANV